MLKIDAKIIRSLIPLEGSETLFHRGKGDILTIECKAPEAGVLKHEDLYVPACALRQIDVIGRENVSGIYVWSAAPGLHYKIELLKIPVKLINDK